MNHLKTIALAATLVCLGVAPISAQVYKDAGLDFTIPKGWTMTTDGETTQVTTPDNLVTLSFAVLADADLEAGLKDAVAEIQNSIPGAEFGDPTSDSLNGFDYETVSGQGDIKGQTATLELAVIYGKQPLMLFDLILPGGDKYEKALTALFMSLRKAK